MISISSKAVISLPCPSPASGGTLLSSVAQSCLTLCDPMDCSTPGLPVHHQLPELAQTRIHGVSDAIQLSHPLSSPFPPAFNFSQHQGLCKWVNSSHEVAKVLEFQLQHHSLQRNPRADLLQNGLVGSPCSPRTLKSLLQHHSSKASILRHSAFFTVQLSHPYMTTRKTIAWTRRTFVGKVMSLLFNMLSRLDITFLPRSNRLLISWLQSPSAVILEPQKIKSDTVSTVSPSISHEVTGPLQSHCWVYNKQTNTNLKDTCTLMFKATLFIIAKIWKQPKCPLTDKQIKKRWCVY